MLLVWPLLDIFQFAINVHLPHNILFLILYSKTENTFNNDTPPTVLIYCLCLFCCFNCENNKISRCDRINLLDSYSSADPKQSATETKVNQSLLKLLTQRVSGGPL